ncbi:DegT/DnrJ/EryC1/StrS family aminotransferase [Clostridiaceae bacterium]|nr:DegT/DnrJ/EryC1/StrS family aminotransferase [Clostridiaceae bacterium]RKI14757.1 DegT/DnrJ/EryC1/StrS family aminotransferase [bacterium 1XD21-70]
MYDIPLFDLNYGTEEEEAVVETIRSNWISTGPKCEEFEKNFAEAIGAKYALSMSNCTDALHLACYCAGIKNNDEVICPSLTFAATVNAIRYMGAIPVFCDIVSIKDLTIDPKKIERLISPKTKAIIVMDYAGFPCQMDEIMLIAKKHSLMVIEDACHGPMSEYKGKCLGGIGDIGCFSFFSNKNISTGEGGMLTTNNDDIYNRGKLLRSHGMTTMSFQRATGHATDYDICEIGYNFRMDDIRASLGIVQLKKLRNDLIKRQDVRRWYINGLMNIDEVIIPFVNHTGFVSNYIMPLILKDSTKEKRDYVRNYLHENGIQTSIHYPAIHKFSAYQEFSRNLPITEYVVDNEITVPMYSSLSKANVDYICIKLYEAIRQFDTKN